MIKICESILPLIYQPKNKYMQNLLMVIAKVSPQEILITNLIKAAKEALENPTEHNIHAVSFSCHLFLTKQVLKEMTVEEMSNEFELTKKAKDLLTPNKN